MNAVQTRRSPAATGLRGNTYNSTTANLTADPFERLLGRLEGVQRHGKGCRALCPACGGKSRKLSVTQGDDGRVLLHDFGGCSPHDVLAAVGLTVSDLFVRRDLRTMTPSERSQLRQAAMIPRWRAALEVLTHEATVTLIAANRLADGHSLEPDELLRMQAAALRIFDAGEVLNAR